ncbi:nitrous oxide reductase accessory protein NosL, partial [Halorubrum tibetense]
MTRIDPFDEGSRLVGWLAVAVVLLAAVVTAGAFLADPTTATPDPVAYDDTVELGLSAETDAQMAGDATVPRAQVFYSQYQYVVGYNGVGTLIEALERDRTDRQFGFPLVVYVSTFDGSDPTTTDDELFAATDNPAWTPATDAVYVVGSNARSPAGEVVVPFADRTAATAFAADHGGEVVD